MNRLVFLFFLLVTSAAWSQEIKLVNLRCEYRVNPTGVGSASPRLSWELQSSRRGVRQSAYRILVSEDTLSLEKNTGTYWDSDKRLSDTSIGIRYGGPALGPGKTYYGKVRSWDERGKDSPHGSHIASLQTGLFAAADWTGARWIGYEALPDSALQIPAPSVKQASTSSVKAVKKTGPF